MATKTPKVKKSASAITPIQDLLEGAETKSQQLARLVTNSSGSAATVLQYARAGDSPDCMDLLAEIRRAGDEVVAGNLGRYEHMLASQALSLDAIFNSLAERAGRQNSLPNMEVMLRLALKAQSQARATIETLAVVKNPMPYIKQANIAHGPQQVNNERATPRAEKRKTPPNKLLEQRDGQWLEHGTQAAAGRADQALAPVGALDRAED